MIDPACGSGHFLLGAFRRLLAAWEARSPATDKWELIREALSSVHGVDKNPFAVAIARFRLMLAAMRAGDVERLTEPASTSRSTSRSATPCCTARAPRAARSSSTSAARRAPTPTAPRTSTTTSSPSTSSASARYHVVVGNPPYITVKDKAENENYRKRYTSCSSAVRAVGPVRGADLPAGHPRSVTAWRGYTGQITANSFMKREFGKKLIEEFFAQQVDLTHVIDTSGAYIPGHGTPTVILFGRRRFPRSDSTIRAVLGVRGEPGSRTIQRRAWSGRRSSTRSTSQAARANGSASPILPRDQLREASMES